MLRLSVYLSCLFIIRTRWYFFLNTPIEYPIQCIFVDFQHRFGIAILLNCHDVSFTSCHFDPLADVSEKSFIPSLNHHKEPDFSAKVEIALYSPPRDSSFHLSSALSDFLLARTYPKALSKCMSNKIKRQKELLFTR